jgi:AcrR family transcriptional regulator
VTAAPADRPLTRRERTYAATAQEIKDVARQLVVESGGAALNLRAVARAMGMTPSALYRYFDSRDALLTALIVESYDSVGSVAEAAAAGLSPDTDPVEAFLTVAHAFRDWAVERPHEFGLLFGTPVPGFEPPEHTLGSELRIANVLLELLTAALDTGRVVLDVEPGSLDPRLHAAMQEVCGDKFTGLTPEAAALALVCWSALLGAIATEVFCHYPPQVGAAPRELFELTIRRQLRSMGFA